MENNTITISVEEYKELVETSASVKAFARYVNRSNYAIDREKCGDILGFDLAEKED